MQRSPRAPSSVERARGLVRRFGASAALALAVGLVAGCGGGAVQQGPNDALRAYAGALEQGQVDAAYRMLSDEAKRNMSLEAFRRAVRDNPEDVLEIARALARPASDPVVTASVTVPNGEELLLVYEGGKWRIDAAAIDLYGQSTPRQALVGFLRAFERKRYDVILRYVPDAEKEGLGPASPSSAPPPAASAAAPAASIAPSPDAPPKAAAAPAPASSGVRPVAPPDTARLTADKLRTAWEGPQKEQMSRIVQALRAALPTAVIEETGDSAAMAYGAGGTVSFLREHGAWKIRDF
jgi:hypothetical protein